MTGNPVEFHPEALAEAEAAAAWYRERSLRVAELFLDELEKAIGVVTEAPNRWPRYDAPSLAGCRKYPLHRFPFFLIYREAGGTIQVLAVAHGRRRPGYWRTRRTG
ncbi:MAG: type II toxin-antitoxin system RelE/ParE family toxin [Terriglobia bacterium]